MSQALVAAPACPSAEAFSALNASRRAVRHFAPRAVPDDLVEALVGEAQLAPSSRNSQPYRFLCVRSPELRAKLSVICEDQSAAGTAPVLIVVTAGRALARETLDAFDAHLEHGTRSEKSRAYHRREARKARLFLNIGAWPVWSPLVALLHLVNPATCLLPLGPDGIRHWTSRSSIYAIQTFLLAARAHGLDTCPMEGFDAAKLARTLALPRGTIIPAVIALGYAAPDARLDPRWRKPLRTACVLL